MDCCAKWVLLALATAAIAGCGGGGGSGSTPSAAITPPAGTGSPNPPPPAPSPTPPPPSPPPSPAPPPPTSALVVVRHIPNQTASIGQFFSFNFMDGGPIFKDQAGQPVLPNIDISGDVIGLSTVSSNSISGTPNRRGRMTITLQAADAQGVSAWTSFDIVCDNVAPRLVRPNAYQFVSVGAPVDYDASQGGTTFTDDDGDPLTYTVQLTAASAGLTANGARVTGALTAPGAVHVVVTASDGRGGVTDDEFMISAPAPGPGTPNLPTLSYVYDDTKLPLPFAFRLSRDNRGAPFWDTTPVDNPTTDAGATLGRVLFYDKRLSVAKTIACGSCHHQAFGFSSGERFSIGVLGVPTTRHVMNLTNVRYNIFNEYFSDMRVTGLESQVLMPIELPSELGFRMPLLIDRLNATTFYPPLFAAAFGTPDITADRIQRAVAQFLRSLISYQSKFDQVNFPLDEFGTPTAAYTPQEQQGADMFRLRGCQNCHQNNVHVAMGAFNDGLDAVPIDPGAGFGAFRPAGLRNVAVSGPHVHDGRFATVRDVIEHYSSGIQLPTAPVAPDILGSFNFTEAEKQALEAFLDTLTDQVFLHDPKFSDPFGP